MARDVSLTSLPHWLERHTAAAPDALRRRVLQHAGSTSSDDDPAARVLVRAAYTALERVVQHPGDRSVALDLLAADGLITLALLHQAEVDPASLAAFARSLTEEAGPL